LQHKTDHLDGTLFIDRLPAAQLADIKDICTNSSSLP
jgi:peptide deformylase